MNIVLSILVSLLLLPAAFAQDKIVIQAVRDVPRATLHEKPMINARNARLVEIDVKQLRAGLMQAKRITNPQTQSHLWLELPLPDGTMASYAVLENTTMSPGLAAKFPKIKTYDGYGKSGELVKFDLTPKGFHAMIIKPGESVVFIDPYSKKDTRYYMVYNKKDFITNKKMHCDVKTIPTRLPRLHKTQARNDQTLKPQISTPYTTCFLKTYKLALAATFEYTQYQGGTIADAMAAEVTTVNRVNGIYEIDAGVLLQLITNNDYIICDYAGCPLPGVIPPGPPPGPPNPAGVQTYTSGNTGMLVTENQTNVDLIIGSANYDIGHVVDAVSDADFAGGFAQIGSVCSPSPANPSTFKAHGVTGSLNPVGDPFDVDFVAHEMGHQFGGNHTFNNSCMGNRNPPTADEPGSGSTIMGYAGICAPNVQNNSDPYFHGVSLDEIGVFTQDPNAGGFCPPALTPIGDAPVITGSNSTVPISTPFALNAAATTTATGATLTYTWEQMNPEFVFPQPPVHNATVGPNFRSFTPTTNPTRYLPNLADLAAVGPFQEVWEVLPSVARVMNFRVSARNNTVGGSCNAFDDFTVTFDATSGPFQVTSQNTDTIFWITGSPQTITWNVENTNNGIVNAQFVNILLSTDGGLTYPTTLATGVPNNGAFTITAPSAATTQGRIMVISSPNNTFFSISSNNFAIGETFPALTQAIRNPLDNTAAYIYFVGIPNSFSGAIFTVNGSPGATATLDTVNNRLIVSNITTPRAVDVSINISITGVNLATNTITIPSILG